MSAATYSQISSFGNETFTALTVQGACRFIPSRTPSTSTASRIEYDTFTSVEWMKEDPLQPAFRVAGAGMGSRTSHSKTGQLRKTADSWFHNGGNCEVICVTTNLSSWEHSFRSELRRMPDSLPIARVDSGQTAAVDTLYDCKASPALIAAFERTRSNWLAQRMKFSSKRESREMLFT